MIKSAAKEKNRLVLAVNGLVSSTRCDAGKRAREIVLSDVIRRFGELPSEIMSFRPGETPDGRVRTEQILIDGNDLWALRFSEPDNSRPGRDWIVEFVSSVAAETAMISLRLSCYSSSQDFNFIPSTPKPLKKIVEELSLHHGKFLFLEEKQEIGIDISVNDLLAEITYDKRWWSIIIVSESNSEIYGVDPSSIQRALKGCANVYFLPLEMEEEFANLVGHDFRVYAGAIRTFHPGFNCETSEPFSHPVLRAPATSDRFQRERALHILCSDAFETTLARGDYRTSAPSFAEVRAAASRARAEQHQSRMGSTAAIEDLRDQLAAAREETETATELGIQAERDREQKDIELASERARVMHMKARISLLEDLLHQSGKEDISSGPESYETLSEWVRNNLAGKLNLTKRAERALKSAQYEDIGFVVECLRLLAFEYRDMKRGILGKDRFEKKLKELKLELSRSITPSRLGEQGDEYYTEHKGKKMLLDQHLKRGTAHDERKSLRVYFLFDDSDEEVVVGWLPGHLKTRKS